MSLTITSPNIPSFIKDEIIIEVETTTTGVDAHYIVLKIYNEDLTSFKLLKAPVIDNKSIFNIGDVINSNGEHLFDLNAPIHQESFNYINWAVKAYEIYDFDDTPQNETGGYVPGTSYRGKEGIFSNGMFFTNFRDKIINRNDFIILFYHSNTIPEGHSNLKLTFNDPANTVLNNSISITECNQILIKSDLYPPEATEISIIIEGLSEEIIFKIENINNIDKETILYRNSFGAYDAISLFAHKSIKENYNYEIFSTKNKDIKYNISSELEVTKASILLNAHFLDEKAAAFILSEIFTSEEVYLIQNMEAIPIIITTKDRLLYSSEENLFKIDLTYKIK